MEIQAQHLQRDGEIGNSIHCEYKTHIDYSLDKIPHLEKLNEKNKEEIGQNLFIFNGFKTKVTKSLFTDLPKNL